MELSQDFLLDLYLLAAAGLSQPDWGRHRDTIYIYTLFPFYCFESICLVPQLLFQSTEVSKQKNFKSMWYIVHPVNALVKEMIALPTDKQHDDQNKKKTFSSVKTSKTQQQSLHYIILENILLTLRKQIEGIHDHW